MKVKKGDTVLVIAGKDRDGQTYIWHYFSNRGGAGGNLKEDGWTNLGCIHNPGGSLSPSIERTEAGFPFLIESYELSPDSGGAGRRRGGLGGIYSLRYEGESDALLNAAGEGLIVPPYGVDGGDSGAVHNYRIIRDGKEDASQCSKLGLEQAVGVGEVNRFEGVAADDLCQTIGLVGGGPGAWPHFI